MWSYNVARSLVREAGLKLIPDRVPKSDKDVFEIAESYVRARPAGTRCVVKLHTMLTASPDVIVIRNKRDIRDRLYSYFQFMKVNFDEESIGKAVSRSLEMDAHYDRWPAGRILNIPYESIGTDSSALICRIAEFAGLPAPDAQTLEDIDFRFSRQQVRKQIAELENRVFDAAGRVRHQADPETVVEVFGRARAFDPASGFQSGHVSDYRPGDWQRLWTDRQRQMVDDAIREVQGRRETCDG